MKILHLPSAVGGNSFALSRGERALGLDSSVLYTASNWLEYGCDINLGLDRARTAPGKFARLAAAFLRIRKVYDVFHFNAGSSLLHLPRHGLVQPELPFYPKRAKLFVTYNGCDARQKLPTMARGGISACAEPDCYGGACDAASDALRRKAIAAMARHVRWMFALNPDLLRFLPPKQSSFLPYAVLMDDAPLPDFESKRLTVLHAPTNRGAKGSKYILAALNRVRQRYPDLIKIVLVEGMPNAKARQLYRQAHIVVDQILIGWYGGLAAESMGMGRAVIARLNAPDLAFLPPRMVAQVREAIIDADPTTIETVLLRCLADRDWLRRKAAAGREYAQAHHSPEVVARICRQVYETL